MAALEETAGARAHFAEVASLLLDGTPLETVRLLARGGAFEPTLVLRAPIGGAGDWDVEEVQARVGQRVEPGAEVIGLYDAREMWLRLEPVGHEIALVARAVEGGAALAAVPVLPGSGPSIDGIRLLRMQIQGDLADRGGIALATVANVSAPCTVEASCRSWQLRVGLRYLVRVPAERLPGRYVLPADALTYDGPSPVVFRRHGEHFEPQPVHVEYADEEVAVVADDGSLVEGETVVVRGAFALGMALQRGASAGADPHAGHVH